MTYLQSAFPGLAPAPAAPRHPARYSDALLPILADMLRGYARVLDPFAGTGKLREVRPDAFLVELEPEWAAIRGAIVGDARRLPWAAGTFDAVCTSPTYGNRMADHHNARDGSRRHTYRHALGRPLSPGNAGALQWGEDYRALHRAAWVECARVLRPGGRLVLNVSDHIRHGERQRVTAWHVSTLEDLGFAVAIWRDVATPRQRMGANGERRMDAEHVIALDLARAGGA